MVTPKQTDKRSIEAKKLEERARKLRRQVVADRVKNFPKVGEQVRVLDGGGIFRRGINDRIIEGQVGIVRSSWPGQGAIFVEFRTIPIPCGECGKRKRYETGRLRFPEECEKVVD